MDLYFLNSIERLREEMESVMYPPQRSRSSVNMMACFLPLWIDDIVHIARQIINASEDLKFEAPLDLESIRTHQRIKDEVVSFFRSGFFLNMNSRIARERINSMIAEPLFSESNLSFLSRFQKDSGQTSLFPEEEAFADIYSKENLSALNIDYANMTNSRNKKLPILLDIVNNCRRAIMNLDMFKDLDFEEEKQAILHAYINYIDNNRSVIDNDIRQIIKNITGSVRKQPTDEQWENFYSSEINRINEERNKHRQESRIRKDEFRFVARGRIYIERDEDEESSNHSFYDIILNFERLTEFRDFDDSKFCVEVLQNLKHLDKIDILFRNIFILDYAKAQYIPELKDDYPDNIVFKKRPKRKGSTTEPTPEEEAYKLFVSLYKHVTKTLYEDYNNKSIQLPGQRGETEVSVNKERFAALLKQLEGEDCKEDLSTFCYSEGKPFSADNFCRVISFACHTCKCCDNITDVELAKVLEAEPKLDRKASTIAGYLSKNDFSKSEFASVMMRAALAI